MYAFFLPKINDFDKYYFWEENNVNKNLVKVNGDDVFTDSWIISEGTGNTHQSVVKHIENHIVKMKRLGELSDYLKCSENNNNIHIKVYNLNEMQASFLMTLLGNSEKVVDFKFELVRQFYAMRQFIFERQNKWWIRTREQGKLTRKAETDVLKQLVEYAKEQGYDHEENLLYINYTKLANKICGISNRESATSEQLSSLSVAENIILHCIQAGIQEEKHYKDIYRDCKQRLEIFKDIAYIQVA